MSTVDVNAYRFGKRVWLRERHSGPRATPTSKSYFSKDVFDRTVALLLLVPGLPLIALLIAMIRFGSSGPGVYLQTRVGRGGCIFTMYKLRSMRIDAEASTGPVWAGVDYDHRVTKLGWWLRRLHLDELPQLFNVLRGEMSLVGPRPERPKFVCSLMTQIPGYLDRLAAKPGITGLAQVNLPADSELDSVRRKIVLDCEYIHSAGLLLDVRLILCTMLRCFGVRGARAVSLFGLRRHVVLTATLVPTASFARAVPVTNHSPSVSI